LKAELSRKQEEVVKAKAQAQANSVHPVLRPKKQTFSTKTNAGVCERAAKDAEDTKQEEDVFKKSRYMYIYIYIYVKWLCVAVTCLPGICIDTMALYI
jgi:hypothetical protein